MELETDMFSPQFILTWRQILSKRSKIH